MRRAQDYRCWLPLSDFCGRSLISTQIGFASLALHPETGCSPHRPSGSRATCFRLTIHVAFTVPAEVADIAFHNKAVVYALLFRAASETTVTTWISLRRLLVSS